MADFLHSFKLTIASEGGYVNDEADHGGRTYRGISERSWPTWAGWAIINKLEPLRRGQIVQDTDLESQCRIFYRQNFWGRMQGDSLHSQRVADSIFDWHVNSGGSAIKAVQRLVGTEPDGRIGSATLARINGKNEAELINAIHHSRMAFYHSIVANNASQKKFLNGWLARAERFA